MGIQHDELAVATCVSLCRDKPPAISNGEKQAALYNIACCHSRIGNLQDGLLALKGVRTTPMYAEVSHTLLAWL